MRVVIKAESDQLSLWTAEYIKKRIIEFEPTETKKHFVLGFPKAVGVEKDFCMSTHCSLWNVFLRHVNMDPRNVFILDGQAPDLDTECKRFEEAIKSKGGIDLLFCGVGNDGHVARNEPGSSLASFTRQKRINRDTALALSQRYNIKIENVSKRTLTMGIATIMAARELLVVFSSSVKSAALVRCLEGNINHMYFFIMNFKFKFQI
eukprot:GSMAST32.ASY1.ANO1.1721.1 assembled CDS